MKRFLFFTVILSLLTSLVPQGFCANPLRLFFEKKASSAASAPVPKHVVKEGEWLFKILQDKGFSSKEMRELFPTIKNHNPHIADLNSIQPGQTIYLPEKADQSPLEHPTRPEPAKKTNDDPLLQKPHIVRSGDTLVNLLKEQGIPENLIFKSYINLFRQMNPDVADINKLRVGQHILLPTGTGTPQTMKVHALAATPLKPSAPKKNSSSGITFLGPNGKPRTTAIPDNLPTEVVKAYSPPNNSTDIDADQTSIRGYKTPGKKTKELCKTPRKAVQGLPYIKTVLQQMRFTFARGDEELYPLPDQTWLHVDLKETPLVTTPWGKKIVFCPIPKNEDWLERAYQVGLTVCTVSPSWNLVDILNQISTKFPENLRLWESGRELSLSRNGLGVTMRCPAIAIIRHHGDKKVYGLWPRQDNKEHPLPQGLPDVLDDMRVFLVELDEFNELSRLPARPGENFIPKATRDDLLAALKIENPQNFFAGEEPQTANALLYQLRSKNLIRQGFANLAWSGGINRRMVVHVPAWIIEPVSTKVVLLDKRLARPSLVALMALEGYHCFQLPD